MKSCRRLRDRKDAPKDFIRMTANSVYGLVVINADGDLAMIKLRVEYHQKCHNCDTELIVDFFSDTQHEDFCPWCGLSICNVDTLADISLKKRIQEAVKQFEDQLNNKAQLAKA